MNYRRIAITLTAVLALTAAGCGEKQQKASEVVLTPTPAPTAAPTAAPVTATPVPTSTPAPRVVGTKTSTAKFVYLTNALGGDIRELYLEAAGTEDWGSNLLPAENAMKSAEQVQLFYTAESTAYDMKAVDKDGNSYEIYGMDLGDMEKASLKLQNGTAYVSYMSIGEKREKDTRTASAAEGTDAVEGDESYGDEDYSGEDYSDESYSEEDYSDESYTEDSEESGGDDTGYDAETDEDYDETYDEDDGSSEDEDYANADEGYDNDDYSEDDYEESEDDGDGDVVWDEEGNWNDEG